MWLAKDLCIFLSTNAGFFKFGSYYFENFLFKDFDIQRIPDMLFSSAFTLSCAMFELVIFEIVGVMDPWSRLMCWRFSLHLMLLLLVFVYPLVLLFLIFKPFLASRPRLFGSVVSICFFIFLYLFWKLGDPFPLLTEQAGSFSLQMGIARIGMVGVTVMSCLSGFGAVEFPLQNMSYFMRDVSDYQIKSAQRQLLLNTEKIILKKKQLCLLRNQKTVTSDIKNQFTNEIQNLETHNRMLFWDFDELNKGAVLHLLHQKYSDLARNVTDSLPQRKDDYTICLDFSFQAIAGTSSLWYIQTLGFCLISFKSTINILFDRVSKKDPITNALELALKWFQISLDVPFWSQHISFVMIGIMIASSIRGFLTKLMSLFSHYSNRDTSTYIGLAFGQIMGMYFVSSILLIRTNLPENCRYVDNVSGRKLARDFNIRYQTTSLLLADAVVMRDLLIAYSLIQTDINSGSGRYPI